MGRSSWLQRHRLWWQTLLERLDLAFRFFQAPAEITLAWRLAGVIDTRFVLVDTHLRQKDHAESGSKYDEREHPGQSEMDPDANENDAGRFQ
jgi:hypothetical protein